MCSNCSLKEIDIDSLSQISRNDGRSYGGVQSAESYIDDEKQKRSKAVRLKINL